MRRKTVSVKIGDLFIGSEHDVKTQSMTTASTADTQSSIDEAIRIFNAGGQLVRFTAPSIKEAKNLKNIRNGLIKKGYSKPLVADIHFTPNAAIAASEIVEKVRINPGNFVDKKKFEIKEYDDDTYNEEVKKIEKKFIDLINSCKKNDTALRIGTNHGSLSDRIMNKFGDTPLGMVESAMEFLRVCKNENFDQIVLSMKSSNPIVMIHAYRLLVKTMESERMFFPLHLGVTEAGDGLDGRIKSALGIGTLLSEGLGDTIRVSLTEDPEFEIPAADKILSKIESMPVKKSNFNNIRAFSYYKRESFEVENIGNMNQPIVISSDESIYEENSPDYIFKSELSSINKNKKYILPYNEWSKDNLENTFPYYDSVKEFRMSSKKSKKINFIKLSFERIKNTINQSFDNNIVFVLDITSKSRHSLVDAIDFFESQKINNPIVFKGNYDNKDFEKIAIDVSIDIGSLFLEGMGNGIWISCSKNAKKVNELSFLLLQNTRTRIFKTDYISCPSCGRTKFDLQDTTAMVKENTSHLKGLKISVMGCIVNGPGEMADADYGYVGSGTGFISLYKGKQLVKRNIPSKHAVDELIHLIRENGDWVDP